ncbi:FecR family protein [Shinella yambaruensis]|nr:MULTISPECIES: FecR family protein [Shinella]CAI0334280.1 FecR family protein [Rhizobiaceae bacterium]CAK7260464.1 transmembrane sensor [Shinella sp. WSC3-e]MCJ8027333.1 FecR family protein [Shinella yambaruensis]MCU7981389.1 FecR family protein [Shinella yambaruensis]MDC7258941.1 FecR family protein [Shinella sp. YE25]
MRGNRANQIQRKRNREATDWLLRNRDPAQTAEEKAHFEDWLSDPENCRTYRIAETLMGDARSAIQSDPVLRNIRTEPRSRAKPVLSAIVLLACATATFLALDGPMRLKADALSGVGEMPVLTLEDGSVVQMNASSAIAVDFDEERRTIRLLRGQAFFRVASVPERPFTVEAGDTRVTALGTAFDVRYGALDTEVTVTEHTVLLEPGGAGSSSMRVSQGEQASYDRASGKTDVQPVDGIVALAWQRGQLAVENAPLSYVIEEVGRHFSGRIVLAGSGLANRRVSGTITVSDTTAALSFIRQALGVKVTRIGPLIVIR